MTKPILTITMNPSVDISYPINHLKIDTVNRVQEVNKTAGGKGLNVARVISQLKEPVFASGVLGGRIGEFISDQLKVDKISDKFMQISQESRNCVAILHDDGNQTEILESGPTLSSKEADDFLKHLDDLLPNVGVLTISGSLPHGVSSDYYAKMVDLAEKHNVRVILDSSGASLLESIESKNLPYLIKPNQDEIAQIVGKDIPDLNELKNVVLDDNRLNKLPMIVISLGAKGALAKVSDKFYRVRIPKIKAVNPVGSGDSTVAGLAVAINRGESVEDMLKTAMTTGILNTLDPLTGHINPSQFDNYFNQVIVEEF